MKEELQDLIDLLHERKCSCVLRNGEIYTFERRGVEDLYALLREQSGLLLGADVADKVVGKGAAALMVLGRVRRVYADVLSERLTDCCFKRESQCLTDGWFPLYGIVRETVGARWKRFAAIRRRQKNACL